MGAVERPKITLLMGNGSRLWHCRKPLAHEPAVDPIGQRPIGLEEIAEGGGEVDNMMEHTTYIRDP